MTSRFNEVSERLIEIETEYEHYKQKTQTELIEMKDRLDMQSNNNFSIEEQLRNKLQVEKHNVDEKDKEVQEREKEIQMLKQQHKLELAALQEELNNV